MDPALLPPLYVAHHESLGEPTEVFHDNIRERFKRGDQAVVGAMTRFAELAAAGREALIARDAGRLARLIDTNFDTRRGIYRLPQWQVDMVETARRCGASAKFAGSGGAILGTYSGEAMFADVRAALAAIGSRTIKPHVAAVPTA
jgi:glucuronokinase